MKQSEKTTHENKTSLVWAPAALTANLSECVSFLAMSENLYMVLSMFVCAWNDVQVTFQAPECSFIEQ